MGKQTGLAAWLAVPHCLRLGQLVVELEETPSSTAEPCVTCKGSRLVWFDDNAGGNCSKEPCPDCAGRAEKP